MNELLFFVDVRQRELSQCSDAEHERRICQHASTGWLQCYIFPQPLLLQSLVLALQFCYPVTPCHKIKSVETIPLSPPMTPPQKT